MIISLVLARFLTQPYIAIHYYLVLNILTVIFAISLLKYDIEHKIEKNSEPFSFLKYWPFWMSLFFMQISFGAFYNFFTIYETQHGMSLEMTSYLWSFGVICEILMLYFQAPLLKNNLLTIVKFCVTITTLRWILLYLYPDSLGVTFLTQSIHAFSFGLYHSSVIIYLYSLYENKKLAQQFMYGVAYGLGGFVGAIVAGAVYGEFLFIFSALFSLLSLIALYFVKTKI
jgi:PPP family 3-phenylpropionic acid transporter